MTPAELRTMEERLRSAYQDLAGAVRPADLSPAPPPAPPGRRFGPAGSARAAARSLAAAVAVALVIAVAAVIPSLAHLGHRGAPDRPAAGSGTGRRAHGLAGQPRFTMSVPPVNSMLEIRDAVTGRRTGSVRVPVRGTTWYGVAASGARTFAAVDVSPGEPSRLYRIQVSAAGTATSVRRIAAIRNTSIQGLTISPDGTWLGYLDLYTPRHQPIQELVRLQNLRTGKIFQWPVPVNSTIVGLSIDAAGDELAVSGYIFPDSSGNHAPATRTYILRPATAGTALTRLHAVNDQAGPLALAPDGRTLYEVLQTAGVPTSVLARATFQLAAVDVSSGRVTAVLHTWHSTAQNFVPLLALDPAGRFLLIVSKTAMAAAEVTTAKYTRLPGRLVPPLQTVPALETGGQILLSPIAW